MGFYDYSWNKIESKRILLGFIYYPNSTVLKILNQKIKLNEYIRGVYLFWGLLPIHIFSFNAVDFGYK